MYKEDNNLSGPVLYTDPDNPQEPESNMRSHYELVLHEVNEELKQTDNEIKLEDDKEANKSVNKDEKIVNESPELLTEKVSETVGDAKTEELTKTADKPNELSLKKSINKNSELTKQKNNEIRNKLTRLARYPNVVERPYCNAIINGKSTTVQILSKRGNEIKVKEGHNITTYLISDFEELVVK